MGLRDVAAITGKFRQITANHGKNPQIAEITGKTLAREKSLASALNHIPKRHNSRP